MEDHEPVQAQLRRRLLLQAAAAAAALPALSGCLGRDSEAGEAGPPVGPLPAAIGTNLSGMEWPKPHVRRGTSTQANLHLTVPRRAEIAWLAQQGLRRNRLPVLWELLQPVLHDARPDPATRAIVGEPGALHAAYAQWITDVLDAHAAAGATCVLDLHNYCRYRDFRYTPEGRVPGLKPPPTPWHAPYTEDPAGWQDRIFSLAPGATLTQAQFADVWTRIAQRWKDHPGLAGWGLMNEPHDLPAPGRTEASEEGRGPGEDLAVWPAYAKVAVEAIRRVDARTPIYVASNGWSSAMALPTQNPGFPLQAEGLVYEVHLYLDAASNGHAFDVDAEVAKGWSAGQGRRAIDADTGVQRLEPALRWARKHGARLALTEVGMPLDDERWQAMYLRTVTHALRHGVEVMGWMAGSHWPIRNHALQQVPGWLQQRTLVPAALGPLLQAAGQSRVALYDEVAAPAADGSVAVTVRARGALAAPLALRLQAEQGSLSATELVLPAGVNPAATLRCTPAPGRVAVLRYAAPSGAEPPPPRRIAALADPVAQAREAPADAALALLQRWRGSQWLAADAWTDYVGGAPAREGQPVRAIADGGPPAGVHQPRDMLNTLNTDSPRDGPWRPLVLRGAGGRPALACGGEGTWGLWCRMAAPEPGVRPRPRDRTPFDLQDPQFLVAVVQAAAGSSGVVVQASRAEEPQLAELALARGVPQARWLDAQGRPTVLAGPGPLPAGRPVVLSLASAPGRLLLRVDGQVVARGQAAFGPALFNQLCLGWGYSHWYPRPGFDGLLFGAIAGRGEPSEAELGVLERHLALQAGPRPA